MSASNLYIIGEIFLALIAGACYLFYYFNKLNDQLQHNNDSLSKRISDEKRHAKGLRVKIQDQTKIIKELSEELKNKDEKYKEDKKQNKKLENDNNKQQLIISKSNEKISSLEDINASIQQNLKLANQQIAELKTKLNEHLSSSKDDFEEMYYDLKNSVAYNMSGGEQVLDILRNRLNENGNIAEGEKLAELKAHYSSLGGMVGAIDGVKLFSENIDEENKSDPENVTIKDAENQIESANDILKQAEVLNDTTIKDLKASENKTNQLNAELEQVLSMNDLLRIELDNTTKQLMAFIQKARLFQTQKEQIKIHKATQNQMHKNFISLNNDHKELSRKYKTLQAKNEILNVQLKNSTDDPEIIGKLIELRKELEEKEQVMDRLFVEKEMLEQQFISISEESTEQANTSHALECLKSEHQLLEQQFLEVLNELDNKKI